MIEKIILFTRFPVPGFTKTRLIPSMGAYEASEFQRKMTEYTVNQARKTNLPIEIRYTGSTLEKMKEWLGEDLSFREQGEGNLGERLFRACEENFQNGMKRVVLIGSDCPSNRSHIMKMGMELLQENECVIGPAKDGGYYLLGINRLCPELFENIHWGTEKVFQQTCSKLIHPPVLLPVLSDVDYPEDIPLKISVIIPVINEEYHIHKTIETVNSGFNVECIVSDGGSTDNTETISRNSKSLYIKSSLGRGIQMNKGAEFAQGDIFLFLHSDCDLPENWDDIIRSILKDNKVVLGAFKFQVKERIPGISFVEWGTNLRSRFRKLPYGDQGLFLKREIFNQLNKFPEIPFLEDVWLVKKARKAGKILIADQPVITSGRRWKKLGVLKTTLLNQLILLGDFLGIPPEKLNRIYRK